MKNNNSSKHHPACGFGKAYTNTVKTTNSVKMNLFCVVTWAMAMTATELTAQVFTTLHSFPTNSVNGDGANPYAGLILAGNTLYGTAEYGGMYGDATVFAVNMDGTGFTNLHLFTDRSGPSTTNSDGAFPDDGLILSGNTLYGTAESGGRHGNGTVFSITLPALQLTITTSGSNIIMTWPTNYAGFD
jgi:uncharacterized repeat protein (TIGR03803 family)